MSKKQSIIVKCPLCNGKGTAPISREMAQTVCVLKELGMATSKDLHAALIKRNRELIGVNAVTNRLRRLIDMGLVQRGPKNGHTHAYAAKL